MPNESLAYILLLFASGALMLILASYAFRKPGQGGIHAFGWLCLSIASYAIFYGLELVGPTPGLAILWNKFQYLGIAFIPVLGLIFVIRFIGKDRWLEGNRQFWLLVYPVVTILLKFTDEWHGLIYKDLGIENYLGMYIFSITPGFWYWVNAAYINITLLIAAILLLRFFIHAGLAFRRQAFMMLGGTVAPWAGHIIYLTGNSYLGLDSAPIYFSLFGIFIALGIFRFGLFDLMPIAREGIFENMRDGVMVIDNHHRIVDINPACRKIFHLFARQVSGKHVGVLLYDYPELVAFIFSDAETLEIRLCDNAGPMCYFLVSKTPVTNQRNKQSGMIISFQDITQSKLAEAALIREKKKAEAANLAKSEFLANMSHEIRTPMNAILGFTETLYERLQDPSHKRMIQSVSSSGKMLLSLLNDILDLSKIEAGRLVIKPVATNIPLMLDEIHMLFKEKIAQKGLTMQIDKQEGFPPNIHIDEIRIRQIIFNLIGNAVKFTQKGGIRVVLSFVEGPACDDGQPCGTMQVVVEDSGIGIDPDQQASIFEPFVQQSGQSNREYGGTGLGLTISKRLVEGMKGSISVQSRLHEGSVFTVTIPELVYSQLAPRTPESVAAGIPATGTDEEKALSASLSDSDRSRIPLLLSTLKETFLPAWKKIQDQLVIFKIEAFAQDLQKTGQDSGFAFLEHYADKLMLQADQIDLEGIKETLTRFPRIIDELEKLKNEP